LSQLEVRLLGRFAVRHQGHTVEALGAKARELFWYLLLNRDHTHNRESLAELLWESHAVAQPRKYLRHALWQLQSALAPHRNPHDPPILHVEPAWIYVDPEAKVWVDAVAFDRAIAEVQGVPGHRLGATAVQALHEAVELYRGDLLEGEYQDWCILERERLKSKYLALLDKLIDYCETHGAYETGLIYAELILRHDRAREQTHRGAMRLHSLAGDRAAALRQFERCAAALAEELDVRPSALTLRLHHQIQADQLPLGPHDPSSELGVLAAPARSLPEVLNHLRQAESMLAELQRHLQHDIRFVERALDSRGS
jgi:DNA-binding SARP family transcriptional activator